MLRIKVIRTMVMSGWRLLTLHILPLRTSVHGRECHFPPQLTVLILLFWHKTKIRKVATLEAGDGLPPNAFPLPNNLGIVWRGCMTWQTIVVGNPENYHNIKIPIICLFFLFILTKI